MEDTVFFSIEFCFTLGCLGLLSACYTSFFLHQAKKELKKYIEDELKLIGKLS